MESFLAEAAMLRFQRAVLGGPRRNRGPMRYHDCCRNRPGPGWRAGGRWIFYSLL